MCFITTTLLAQSEKKKNKRKMSYTPRHFFFLNNCCLLLVRLGHKSISVISYYLVAPMVDLGCMTAVFIHARAPQGTSSRSPRATLKDTNPFASSSQHASSQVQVLANKDSKRNACVPTTVLLDWSINTSLKTGVIVLRWNEARLRLCAILPHPCLHMG